MTPCIFTTTARRYLQTNLTPHQRLYQGRIYSIESSPLTIQVLSIKNGSYTGQVNKKNQPEGQGVLISARGKAEGRWKEGRFITGFETYGDLTSVFIQDPNGRYSEI